MTRISLLSLFLVLLSAGIAADGKRSPDVGDVAPEITDADWVLNAPPAEFSLERYRGRVVLIQQWWFPCPACRSTFEWLEARYREFHSQGLEVFAFEQMSTRGEQGAAEATREAILALIEERGGVSYPVSRGGTDQNFRGSFEFPYFWLLDIDGKVVFHEEAQGPHYNTTRAKLLELIPQELKRIYTPQLGHEVHSSLARAAARYDAGAYGDSLAEIDKATRREEDEAVLADAQFLRDSIAARATDLMARVEQQVEEGSYLEAFESLAFIENAFGKKHDAGKAATARVKELKKDKVVKQELKAAERLEKLLAKLAEAPTELRNRALDRFIEDNQGTRAAASAAAQKR